MVVFGHMHHRLHRSAKQLRRMVAVDKATGTFFLNAATVPRLKVGGDSLGLPRGGPHGELASRPAPRL